jgi:hypothetical protein
MQLRRGDSLCEQEWNVKTPTFQFYIAGSLGARRESRSLISVIPLGKRWAHRARVSIQERLVQLAELRRKG